MLSKLRYFLPRHTLKTIYNSLVLPHLQYGITLWGIDCSRISVLQKQCVRRINKVKKYKAHTDPLFKKSSILKVEDIYKLFTLKFFHKYSNDNLPEFFLDDFFPKNAAFHRYETSTSNQYYILTHNSKETRRTIRYQVPYILNNIPSVLLSKIKQFTIKTFSKHLKVYFIEKYDSYCPVGAPTCYVCAIK